MNATIDRGLASSEKILPGGLGVMRKAAEVFSKKNIGLKMFRDIFAYALACAEENAAGGEVVTAPTCGSCGVVPAVLRYLHESEKKSEEEIIRSLATAGLIGNLVRTNASISGAAVGCQGEIGTACAMAAAACCQLLGGNINQIEYAAEMGIEHLLGLTCDPIGGLVQIPCIERNIMAAGLALLIAHYALYTTGKHLIPFDLVVQAMKDTGFLMDRGLRETSRSGLARFWPDIVKEAAQQLVGTPGTS
jgi:L-serine dehydratase